MDEVLYSMGRSCVWRSCW